MRRNLTLGILNGVFFNVAIALLSGAAVMPLFISGLTDSRVIIGAFSVLEDFGWNVPQLFAGAYIMGRPLVLGFYNRLSISRIVLFSLAVMLIFIIEDNNSTLLLLSFGVFFAAYSLASGMAGISFMEIVGKMIPTNKRGTLLGMRMFLGGLLAVLCAPLVKKIIEGWEYPSNFGYIYLLTLLMIISGLAVFAFVKEKPKFTLIKEAGFKDRLALGWKLFKSDRNIRKLIYARFLTHSYLLAAPFYVIMATEYLGISRALAATYLSFHMVGYLGLNFLWGWLSNNVSNKWVLKASILCSLMPPLLALLAFIKNPGYYLFGIVFFFSGASLSGISMGYINYILEIVEADNRPLAIGLVHTLIAPTVFLSMLGGLIFELFGLKFLFIATLICLLISFLYITRLREPQR